MAERKATIESAPTLLRFITCGSVDDGKSTLIGRMLYDAGLVPEDQWASVQKLSAERSRTGDRPDYSLLLDGLLDERARGITIDVAYRARQRLVGVHCALLRSCRDWAKALLPGRSGEEPGAVEGDSR